MRYDRRPQPLVMDESDLHLRLPVRKADDLRMTQSALWPRLKVM